MDEEAAKWRGRPLPVILTSPQLGASLSKDPNATMAFRGSLSIILGMEDGIRGLEDRLDFHMNHSLGTNLLAMTGLRSD